MGFLALIDNNLVNWLSVELISNDTWDDDVRCYADDIEFIGCAVVLFPASDNVYIKRDGPKPTNH